MKYLNKKLVGAEMYLSTFPLFNKVLSKYSVPQLMGYLSGSFLLRSRLVKSAIEATAHLSSDRFAMADLLPDGLLNRLGGSNLLGMDSYIFPQVKELGGLKILLKWIGEIARINESNRRNWLMALSHAIDHMPAQPGDFIRNFATLTGSHVTIQKQDNQLILSPATEVWGKTALILEQFEATEELIPSAGSLFMMECEKTESGFEFRFLLEQEESNDLVYDRAMSDTGFLPLTVRCQSVSLKTSLDNYTQYYIANGFPRLNAAACCCGDLLHKFSLLGTSGITPAERNILPLCKFLAAAGILEDKITFKRSDTLMLEDLLQNHYQFGQLCHLVRHDLGDEELAKMLEETLECYDEDGLSLAKSRFRIVLALLRIRLSHAQGLSFFAGTVDLFASVSSSFTGHTGQNGLYRHFDSAFQSTLLPAITKLGFHGTFPHFRRIRGHSADFITFFRIGDDELPMNPVFDDTLSFSLAVGQAPVTNPKSAPEIFEFPFEAATAHDAAFWGSLCKYAVIMTPSDGGPLQFCPGDDQTSCDRNRQSMLDALFFLDIANLSLSHQPLPKKYLTRLRTRHLDKNAFDGLGYLGFIVGCIYMILAYSGGAINSFLMFMVTLTISAGAGSLVVWFIKFITKLRLKFSRQIWNKNF